MIASTPGHRRPPMPEPTHRAFDVEQSWIGILAAGKITEIKGIGMVVRLGWPRATEA